MIQESSTHIEPKKVSRQFSELQRILRVLFGRKMAALGIVLIIMLILTAVFAPLLAPHDPYKMDLDKQLLQPSKDHILGTDRLGRDTLSRIIYGARTSLIVGAMAITIAALVGMTLGLVAAYYGGWVNTIIMRLIDAQMAFPPIMLMLVIASVLGGGTKNVIIALGIGMIPSQARLMCAQALSIKQNDYVLASRATGASDLQIMLRHVLPNCFPPLIVLITIELGICILAEAGLSFLGIGINPPGAAWGSMVNDGYRYLLTHPILSFAPGFAIMLVVFGFNMAGDGLRDALDPRLRGTL